MKLVPLPFTLTLMQILIAATALIQSATAIELLSEDFNADGGGFTEASEGNSPIPFVYNSGAGTWSVDGDDSGPSGNTLTSPPINMPATGGVAVSFQHRYSTEAEWDGTAVQVSIGGGPFVTIPAANFTANGYDFPNLIGNHALNDQAGFNGDSPGYSNGEFITSTANVWGIAAGSDFAIRFLGAWDEGARGPFLPNWEIDALTVETLPDTDSDGIPDAYEDANQLDKAVDDTGGDPDLDGLTNIEEFLAGTDPQDADTDHDGLLDGVETGTGIFASADDTGTDPLNPDSDGDLLLDGVESNSGTFVDADDTGSDPNDEDSDGDGFPDGREVQFGSDPTNPASIPTGNVIAAYSFDDATAVDDSGHGFDGAIVGAASGAGMVGDALVFDGSDNSYVTVPDLGTHDELTVSAWFKVTGRVGQWRVIYNVDGWSAGWLHHQLYPNNSLGFSINANLGGNDRNSSQVFDNSTLDVWHHSAAVYSSIDGTLKFYFDGVLDREYSWGGNPVVLRPGRIGGWSGGGRGFQGIIDEVVFLDYAASQDQVLDLMNRGIQEPLPIQITSIAVSGGTAALMMTGKPLTSYLCKSSPDLTTPFTEISTAPPTVTTDDNGDGTGDATFTVDASAARRFYLVEQAPPVMVFSENFDGVTAPNLPTDWTTGASPPDTGTTQWQLGTPSVIGPSAASSAPNCLATNIGAEYGLDTDIWLRTPAIDLTAVGGATLAFKQFRSIENVPGIDLDFGSIRILAADDLAELAVLDAAVEGDDTDWVAYSKALPAEAFAEPVVIEFRFQSDEIDNFAGWYLDDVTVTVP